MAIDYRIFPTSGRFDSSDSSYDSGTNLITEYNIASLINQLTDKPGFVISDNGDSSNASIEFNIKGYYFQITVNNNSDIGESNAEGYVRKGDYVELLTDNSTSLDNIKATIYIDENPNIFLSYRSLIPLGTNDGVNPRPYSLILRKNGKTPLTSRIHFNTYLDDGDLDDSSN